MKKYIIISIAALLAIIAFLSFRIDKLNEERARLSDNQSSLLSDVDYYRTNDSLSAAAVSRLLLNIDEYGSKFSDQASIIESLNIKLKRVQSVTQTGTTTDIPIKAQIKDSLILRDSLVLLPCINYHNSYFDFNGCIEQKQFTGKISIRDTLTHVAHRIPKKFLFFRFGTKRIQLDVVSSNPYTTITYARYVELQ